MAVACIDPDKIQPGDLLAYIEGAATPEVVAHIRQCPACAAEVAALRKADMLLASALYRAACPETDELLQYQADLLSAPDQRRIAQHLEGCADCRRELAALTLPEPAPPTPAERLATAGKRLLRGLLISAGAQPALALRGGEPRQLEYQAGDYQLILALTPPLLAEDVWRLEGQIMNAEATATLHTAPVLLRAEDAALYQDQVDAFGYFAFEQVRSGVYTLQIDLPGDQILIEDIQLL